MDRHHTLLQLAQKMSAATASEDWKTLAAINTLMTSTLPAMAAQGKWTPAERAALTVLRQLHQQAAARCDQAAAGMDQHLSAMRTHKEGWLAYALNSEYADIGTRA